MSVAKTLINLNGQRVTKRVTGIHTVETLDAFREELKANLALNEAHLAQKGLSADDLKEEDTKFTLGQYFWFKPKLKAEETGVLHVRSKDYFFVPDGTESKVYGDKKGFAYSIDLTKVEKPLLQDVKANKGALVSFELVA